MPQSYAYFIQVDSLGAASGRTRKDTLLYFRKPDVAPGLVPMQGAKARALRMRRTAAAVPRLVANASSWL